MPNRLPMNYGRQPMYIRQRQSLAVLWLNIACAVLLTTLLFSGVTLFALWLSLMPHRPEFSLAEFSIPNLNRQSGAVNLPVKFTVNERNPNLKIGIHFDKFHGSVYYNDELIASGPVVFPFFGLPKKDMPVQGELTASGPGPTDPAWPRFVAEVGAGSVGLRLVLDSTMLYQVRLFDTREHHMKVDCDFIISGNGSLVQEYKNAPCKLNF
jgi:hypothetical protein